MSRSRGRESMKKLSGVLEGLGSQVKHHQWKLVHRSTARWDQCALVCRLIISSHFYMYVEQWLFFMPSLLPVPPHFPLFSSLLRLHVPSSSSSPSFPSFPCPCLSPPLLSISSPFLFLPHLLSSLLSYSPPTQHHSAEVLKWEESKRWQKRLEGLRTKLTEKNRELEAAQRQIKALKETLARCVS